MIAEPIRLKHRGSIYLNWHRKNILCPRKISLFAKAGSVAKEDGVVLGILTVVIFLIPSGV